MKRYIYVVTGDFDRLVYSRHMSLINAQKACVRLNNKWKREDGFVHPGSEARVELYDPNKHGKED